MTIFLYIKFTFTKGVPKLDRLVTRARDDLPVVSAEADRQDVRGVPDKFSGRLARVQVPETEGVIPRCGESELAIRGNNDVGNEVVVSVENPFWITERVFISGQLPDDDSFVCGETGQSLGLLHEPMTYIPREAVRIISGFSEEVAIAVTHPAWPGSEPRKRKDSISVWRFRDLAL